MVLGIYGCGGLGREVYVIANKINRTEGRWDKIIFIDDAAGSMDAKGNTVCSFIEAKETFPQLEVVIGIGEPSTRAAIFEKVKQEKTRLTTIIHPGVYIDDTTNVGEGTVICEGAYVSCNGSIGCNAYIQPHAVLGHDLFLGDHSVIGGNSHIGGANHIGERTYIGFLAGTKEGLTIGNDVICSAGAIVFRDLPDAVIAVGNPARIMKKNEDRKVFHAREEIAGRLSDQEISK